MHSQIVHFRNVEEEGGQLQESSTLSAILCATLEQREKGCCGGRV
jgi:hypothetical protein